MRLHLNLKPRLSAHESYVVSWMMLAMIVVPALALVWPAVTGRLDVWWVDVGTRVGVLALTALVVGGVMRRMPKFHAAVTPLAYAHAFMNFALIWIVYGFLVLATGRTPSKLVHRRIPRIASIRYLGIAGALALLAVLCGLIAERHRRRSVRAASSA